MTPPRSNGTISLLTDFGQRDPFVGVMKAVILAACPDATLVDLTHEIEPQDVRAAAFWLERVVGFFAPGSVHLVVVDPGVGSARRALACAAGGQLLVGPDNGVLEPTLRKDPDALVVELTDHRLASIGRTFDGRDLFAPAAARLCAGAVPEELGATLQDWERLDLRRPKQRGASITGAVVVVDHFGNLISDIELDPEQQVARVTVQGQRVPWGRSYSDVALGQPVALLNSWGCVEVAVRQGSAAAYFAANSGTRIELLLGN
jgi:S-adenosylmethionine hydrolase